MIAFLRRLFGKQRPQISLASLRDAKALARIHAASFHRGWSAAEFEQILIERNAIAHRVRLGGRTVGFIVSRVAGDEAEILSVAVERSARGNGIGRNLLLAHLSDVAAQGVRAVFLEVEASNAAARTLYRHAGFYDVGLRPSYYAKPGAEPQPAHVMRRDLL